MYAEHLVTFILDTFRKPRERLMLGRLGWKWENNIEIDVGKIGLNM
jgi:hypothetical protein